MASQGSNDSLAASTLFNVEGLVALVTGGGTGETSCLDIAVFCKAED